MNFTAFSDPLRRRDVRCAKLLLIAFAIVASTWPAGASAAPQTQSGHRFQPTKGKPGLPGSSVDNSKLDKVLKDRSNHITGANQKDTVDVIATMNPGQDLPASLKKYARRYFGIIDAYELDNVPVTLLPTIEKEVSIHRAHYNHKARSLDLLSNTAIEADALVQESGYTGAGVGVAFVDSGFTSYPQPDLKDSRIATFVDFVKPNNKDRIDLNGHGTQVAGIVGGTGKIDSKEKGIATGTSIVSLRVLDEQGEGTIGDIIAALDWVANNYVQYNVRIVNMSVGAGVYESGPGPTP